MGHEPSATALAGPELPLAAEVGIDNLNDILFRLCELGAHQYAPARFFAIQALVERVSTDRAPVSPGLKEKAIDNLAGYVEELHLAQQQVVSLTAQLREQYPQAETELSDMARNLDIRAVLRLQRRLQRQSGPGPLARLSSDLAGPYRSTGLPQANQGFSGDLRAQELEILSQYQQAGSPKAELRSAQRYRQAMLRVGAQQLVDQAQAQSPADSGPLNPQRLATRSLAVMQDLSPAYTARFVSYIDTLFYLESLPAK